MTFHLTHMMSSFQPSSRFPQLPARKLAMRLGSGLMALSLSLGVALPSLADDPFRDNTTTTPRNIGPLTEQAFEAIFKDGDYKTANSILADAKTAEANEPLVHAMLASMAYLSGDLEGVYAQATTTKAAAESLKSSDPLRGHLYSAVGIFLEGAYILKQQGVAKGTPTALGMLQKVFSELDDAEAINPNDPELNLLKGYMDLMLAVNLPFSNPAEAISQMDAHGSPVYLTQRGIALGYRDMGQYDKAIISVDKAIAAAPDNPELMYLKAQLLAKQGAKSDSAGLFAQALEYAPQLPSSLARQIARESCFVEELPEAQCEARKSAAQSAAF